MKPLLLACLSNCAFRQSAGNFARVWHIKEPTRQRPYRTSDAVLGRLSWGNFFKLFFVPVGFTEVITAARDWRIDRSISQGKDTPAADATGPRFLSKRDFLADFVPPDYLIDGVLQRRFTYSLTHVTSIEAGRPL